MSPIRQQVLFVAGGASLALAAFASPWASPAPDGLRRTLEIHAAAPAPDGGERPADHPGAKAAAGTALALAAGWAVGKWATRARSKTDANAARPGANPPN